MINKPPDVHIACGDPKLLEETTLPDKPKPTTQALIDYMIELRGKVNECNADKRAFQQMVDDQMEAAND